MNLDRYDKIEALVSAIEEEQLRLFEANAMTAQYDHQENELEQEIISTHKERILFFIKQANIYWRYWLMRAKNVYSYNLTFYKKRLQKLIGA